MIYFYKRKAEVMDADRAELVMDSLEAALRAGSFKYNSSSIYQSQIEGIKASWPEQHRKFMRDLVTKSGSEPGPAVIRHAMNRTLSESLAQSRALLRNTSVQTEMKAISSDLCLSMLFRMAPDAGVSGGRRKYGSRMIITRTLGEYNPKRVIVKKADLESADTFVFFLYNSELMRSWAVGWMSRNDVSSLPCGDKSNDPENCPWAAPCHHGVISGLKPMFELVESEGIHELCGGVMFERVPDVDDIPVKTRTQMEEYMNGRESSADEFWQVLGLKNPSARNEHAEAENQEL